jgi:methyltransferase
LSSAGTWPWSFVVFAIVLAAVGALRLGELALSVARIRRRPEALVGEPGLFPAMALLHAAVVTLPLLEVAWLDRPFRPWLAIGAASVLVVATALRIWTLATIGRAWNVRIVRPEPGAIATGGPYRFVRHPNYLCVVLELAALPLLHGAWVSAIVLSAWNAAVLHRRIRNEEAALAQITEWRNAFADRPRLFPGLY